jgi:hypothetical protein
VGLPTGLIGALLKSSSSTKSSLNTLFGMRTLLLFEAGFANTTRRPGMREHALFSRDRYATNRLMEPFCKHLRFAWPHDPQDTYEMDPKSELFSFTSLYIKHQARIEYWQMDPEFFSLFPELRAEIPALCLSPLKSLINRADFSPWISRQSKTSAMTRIRALCPSNIGESFLLRAHHLYFNIPECLPLL